MDPRKLYFDERHRLQCAYCGAPSSSADHVPSRVLLDDPLPPNLPVVGACDRCNQGFSLDEEYVAVALECARCGSVDPSEVSRAGIAENLRTSPRLARRIARASATLDQWGQRSLQIEPHRLRNVLLKLARGHVAYEFGEPALGDPETVWYGELARMTASRRAAFEAPVPQLVLPEIGTRAFLAAVDGAGTLLPHTWRVVQEGRYRYLGAEHGRTTVRIVLSEFLAYEVHWE